jgi:hypothetical protein
MVYCLLDLDLVNKVSNNGGLLACFYDFGLACSLRCSRVNNRHKHDLGRFSPHRSLSMHDYFYLFDHYQSEKDDNWLNGADQCNQRKPIHTISQKFSV